MKSTILIVEDDHVVRASLRDWLNAVFPYCHLIEAGSGEEAVALARDLSSGIVLMDIQLPQMNGIEATRLIKEAVPQAQVVMLSIHEAAEYRTRAASAGASAFVPKCKMHCELISVVSRLMS